MNSIYRILVVDDDPEILRMVKTKLEHTGYDTLTADSGRQALEVISRRGLPHLAVVDVKMPGMDGFQLCEALQAFCDLPVIFLSAVNEEDTIIQGIQRYAEDYIVKPFSPRELVARIERILRRIGHFGYTLEPRTQVDDYLVVDFAHQLAYVDSHAVSLTPTETKLLYLLMRNAGHTVTTDFLLRRLWPLEEVYEDTLRVHVHRLRHKIEPLPNKPRYVLTERGIGYKFPAKA